MITTSLIIPTLNRADDLTRCLTSITQLTKKFDQIIVVEQGNLQITKRLVKNFPSLNISVYFHPVHSAAQARNAGIKKAIGDLIFFTDDDTELDRNYVSVAIDYFASHPQIMGLTGKIVVPYRKKHLGVAKIFLGLKKLPDILLLHASIHMKVLRSGSNSHSIRPCKVSHDIEWMQGCHMAFRTAVFEEKILFNADFVRWSCGEDLMLSYQVYQRYGKGSLCYLPAFIIKHHEREESSLSEEAVIKMQIIYRFIFWHRAVYRGKILNLICYLYGQLGYLKFLLTSHKNIRYTLRIAIETYLFLLKNWREIATNQIDYNQFILLK